jgi:hypothetical protein
MDIIQKLMVGATVAIALFGASIITYETVISPNKKEKFMEQHAVVGTAIVHGDYYSDITGEYVISTTDNSVIRTDGRLSGEYQTAVSSYAAMFEKGDTVKFKGYYPSENKNLVYFNTLEKIVKK